ncbi:serine/threonine protein kinase [Herbidospora sp. NEAU-GS84]|uniref:Serine/threonine protein kinase n=1 Tax=Herbidospora solisilvae TaxID=2696284 RepID=A0A7C9NBX0_9ACTN|nr:serine/threonine protein kinase [Herbidospora solisilvae]NAS20655.1 serine/threonine protein kinase [Herbidospora solisilvae]
MSSSDEPPERRLARLGTVFARFDRQDSGNVSYGAVVDGERCFVKTAGHPDATAFLDHARRVDLLRNAVRLARAHRHPALPALRMVVESAHGPMLVYDWADGDLIGVPRAHRDDPASPYRRFLALPPGRVLAALDTIVDVHDLLGQAGEVAGDFYDGCLLYDFITHRLSLIDLDNYRPGPYRNDMGRMFGSSRFMAPEEFTLGSVIDQRTSVFTLGRTAQLLLGDHLHGPLQQVTTRATHPNPEERHGSLPEFCAAWRAARQAGC